MILYLFSGISGLISFLNCVCLIALRGSTPWDHQAGDGNGCPFSVCHHVRAAFVCRMPQQTCCRHRLLCACWAAVVRGVCSRPAVSVPFSVAFITDLTNIKAWSSMCDCRFARFASAEMWRQFKDSSSPNNCCFEKVQLHVSLSKTALPGWGEN